MRKCYLKELCYIVPKLKCDFCNKQIKTGDKLFTVILKWGDGRVACESCYKDFEVDENLHEDE